MKTWYDNVKEFSVKAEMPINKTPEPMTEKEINFIIQMVQDEMNELDITNILKEETINEKAIKIAQQADALVDAIYYLCDCAVKKGVNLNNIFSLVHNANMSKLKNGVIKNDLGKVLKPEGWESPDDSIVNEIMIQLEGSE